MGSPTSLFISTGLNWKPVKLFKLRNTKVTENASQWDRILREEMKKTRRKLYNLTTYLHDFPDEILQKKIRGEIDIAITYQFRKYPQLNYSDEKNLFDRLIAAGVELRHITLKNRHPIGIRIVDEKWATFLLPKVNQKELDRDHAFISTGRLSLAYTKFLQKEAYRTNFYVMMENILTHSMRRLLLGE